MFGRCMRKNPPYSTYLAAQLKRMEVMPTAGHRGCAKDEQALQAAAQGKEEL